MWLQVSVRMAPVFYAQNQDKPLVVVYVVDDAIDTDTNPIRVRTAAQLEAAARSGVLSQHTHRVMQAPRHRARESIEVLLRPAT